MTITDVDEWRICICCGASAQMLILRELGEASGGSIGEGAGSEELNGPSARPVQKSLHLGS